MNRTGPIDREDTGSSLHEGRTNTLTSATIDRNHEAINESMDEEVSTRDFGDVRAEMPESSTREIVITPLNYGYIVKVGCQKAAIESNDMLIKALKVYLDNPNKFEKDWFSTNTKHRLEDVIVRKAGENG